MDPIIQFINITKQYQIGQKNTTLREALMSVPKRLIRPMHGSQSDAQKFLALNNVTFYLEKGNVLGVIGSNGAGKTTILRLLSGITRPNSGDIVIKGRQSALIELGAGFHPELTGRENVFLNGVILGMTKREIKDKFDEIVEFAELEKFIDTPVKHYSSGMYARLGFAVAAFSNPDILLVDEVLAVGDLSFQQKCYDFIHSFVSGGKTAVFVSHNMFVIEQLCNRVLWLDHGKVLMLDEPGKVISAYLDNIDRKMLSVNHATDSQNSKLMVGEVFFTNSSGERKEKFFLGEDITVTLKYRAQSLINNPYFVLVILDSLDNKPLIIASMLVDKRCPDTINGEGTIQCIFKAPPLMPRVFHLWGEVWGSDQIKMLFTWQHLGSFSIILNDTDPFARGGSVRHLRMDAPVRIPYEWKY